MTSISRRELLAGAVSAPLAASSGPGFPLVDYHVHLDEVVTLEKALQLSRERGVKFGIVEHAGGSEYDYARMLSNDAELKRYISTLDGKPVLKGIQAEGVDWMKHFSPKAIAQLDYVLTDALTLPEKDGHPVKIWTPAAKIADPQEFMERYVAFHIRIMARQPIDILANPTFLPTALEDQHDALWTPARMERIVNAAVKYGVAIEINSRYRLPKPAFLKLAKTAGAKFSFGSNIHGLDVGKLDYCLEMAKELGLKASDMFSPAPPGHKPVERRKRSA